MSTSSRSLNVAKAGRRPTSWRRQLPWMLAVGTAALGAFGLYAASASQHSSSGSIAAVVRMRRIERPGEDVALAVDQVASQILSPGNIRESIRNSAVGEGIRSDQELAEQTERWRGRLRVDVEPSDGKQPWTISVQADAAEKPEEAASLVNAVAEVFLRSSREAAGAEAAAVLRTANAQSDKARQKAILLRHELDELVDNCLEAMTAGEQAAPVTNRAAEPAHAETAESSPANGELSSAPDPSRQLSRELAELEARRAALLERLLPAHPDVQAIEREIVDTRERLDRLPPPTPLPDMGSEFGNATATPPATKISEIISSQTAETTAKIQQQRQALARIETQLAADIAAERRAEELLMQAQMDDYSRVQQATVDSQPAHAFRMPLAVLLSLLSAACGWLLARWTDRRSSTFTHVDQIEAALGLPVIGSLSIYAEEQHVTIASPSRRVAS